MENCPLVKFYPLSESLDLLEHLVLYHWKKTFDTFKNGRTWVNYIVFTVHFVNNLKALFFASSVFGTLSGSSITSWMFFQLAHIVQPVSSTNSAIQYKYKNTVERSSLSSGIESRVVCLEFEPRPLPDTFHQHRIPCTVTVWSVILSL